MTIDISYSASLVHVYWYYLSNDNGYPLQCFTSTCVLVLTFLFYVNQVQKMYCLLSTYNEILGRHEICPLLPNFNITRYQNYYTLMSVGENQKSNANLILKTVQQLIFLKHFLEENGEQNIKRRCITVHMYFIGCTKPYRSHLLNKKSLMHACMQSCVFTSKIC